MNTFFRFSLLLLFFYSCTGEITKPLDPNPESIIVDTTTTSFVLQQRHEIEFDHWRFDITNNIDLDQDEKDDLAVTFGCDFGETFSSSQARMIVLNDSLEFFASTSIDTSIWYYQTFGDNEYPCSVFSTYDSEQHTEVDSFVRFFTWERTYPTLLAYGDTLELNQAFIATDTLSFSYRYSEQHLEGSDCSIRSSRFGYPPDEDNRYYIGYRIVGEETKLGFIEFTHAKHLSYLHSTHTKVVD